MSVHEGIRAAAKAYHDASGGVLRVVYIEDAAYRALVNDAVTFDCYPSVGGLWSEKQVEIDDTLVLPISKLRAL